MAIKFDSEKEDSNDFIDQYFFSSTKQKRVFQILLNNIQERKEVGVTTYYKFIHDIRSNMVLFQEHKDVLYKVLKRKRRMTLKKGRICSARRKDKTQLSVGSKGVNYPGLRTKTNSSGNSVYSSNSISLKQISNYKKK